MPVFVGQQSLIESEHSRDPALSLARMPKTVDLAWGHRAVPYFFMVFLPMNNFSTGQSVQEEVSVIVKTSRGLRDAIEAVATLHYNRYSRQTASAAEGRSHGKQALQAYSRAVRHVQSRITSGAFLGAPCALWTTFVLGLFEVSEPTMRCQHYVLTQAAHARFDWHELVVPLSERNMCNTTSSTPQNVSV